MEESELATIVWRAPEWITALGGLRPDNVLEYFAQSPFFDKRSNNAVLKMQSQFQNFGNVNEALKKMTGIEFVVSSYSVPDMFTINMQDREGPEDVRILKVFLIANGNVYLAPDAHRIVTSRMLNVTHSLKAAIDLLQSAVSFDPASGHQFTTVTDKAIVQETQANEKLLENQGTTLLTPIEVQSMHKVLYNTVKRMT